MICRLFRSAGSIAPVIAFTAVPPFAVAIVANFVRNRQVRRVSIQKWLYHGAEYIRCTWCESNVFVIHVLSLILSSIELCWTSKPEGSEITWTSPHG